MVVISTIPDEDTRIACIGLILVAISPDVPPTALTILGLLLDLLSRSSNAEVTGN